MKRIKLRISVPKETPDSNWKDWDLESFILEEHLFDLIKSYGIEKIKEELEMCENFLIKNKNIDG